MKASSIITRRAGQELKCTQMAISTLEISSITKNMGRAPSIGLVFHLATQRQISLFNITRGNGGAGCQMGKAYTKR